MKYTNKKKLITVMTLLIVAASFGGCNSANTTATIDPEVTSSEIVSSAPVSSEATSSETASSAPMNSEAEKPESEAAPSEATTSSAAEVSSKTEAPVVSSEPAVSSVPTAVSQPAVSSAPAATTSQPVSSTATSAPAAKTVSAPAQQKSGSTKAFEDMTIEEQDQWLLDQLNQQLGSMEVHEYGTDGGNSAESTQPAEGVGDVYEAIRLINEERVKAGLNELEVDDTMMEMAAVRAKELSVLFDHTRPDGTDCWTIFEEFGQRQPLCVENAGAGKGAAEWQVGSWMNSTAGHKENILWDGMTRIGVGYYYQADSQYGHYWIMLAAS